MQLAFRSVLDPRLAKVFSYERVSSHHQAQGGRGLERQSDDAEEWCKKRGLELDNSLDLTDPGVSAFHGDNVADGALGRFLALAQAGDLGPSPILLVESVDRLSRLELITALQDLIFGLLRAGVTIETLEDGQQYTAAAVNSDIGRVIQLIAKVHAAHEYSKKLSRRIKRTWDQAIGDLEAGILPRGAVFCPPWCIRTGNKISLVPEKAKAVRLCFEYSLTDGDFTVAARLNAEGIPSMNDKPWSTSKVRNLLNDPRVWGAVRLNRQDNMSSKRRERRGARAEQERVFPDLLPLILTKAEVDLTLASRAARSSPEAGSGRGKKGSTMNIASRLTRCSCGAASGVSATNSGSRKNPDGTPLKLRYLKCSARCGAKSYRLDAVNAHLLTRLNDGQLQRLLAADTGRGKQIKAEQVAISQLQAQMAQAEQAETNAAKLFKDALKAGQVDPLFREAVEEARVEVEAAKTALTKAQQRLANLRHEIDSHEYEAALHELFDAFANDADTPEQRLQINRFLVASGVRVTLSAEGQRVGLAIGDGEPEWQPIGREIERAALRGYMTGAKTDELKIDEETVAMLRELAKQQGSTVVDISDGIAQLMGMNVEGQYLIDTETMKKVVR